MKSFLQCVHRAVETGLAMYDYHKKHNRLNVCCLVLGGPVKWALRAFSVKAACSSSNKADDSVDRKQILWLERQQSEIVMHFYTNVYFKHCKKKQYRHLTLLQLRYTVPILYIAEKQYNIEMIFSRKLTNINRGKDKEI